MNAVWSSEVRHCVEKKKSGIFCLSFRFYWTFSLWSEFIGFATELCHLLMIFRCGWQGLKQKYVFVFEVLGRAQEAISVPCAQQHHRITGYFRWDRTSGGAYSSQSKPNTEFRPGLSGICADTIWTSGDGDPRISFGPCFTTLLFSQWIVFPYIPSDSPLN